MWLGPCGDPGGGGCFVCARYPCRVSGLWAARKHDAHAPLLQRRNPQPSNPNPRPQPTTLNPKPSTLSAQPSTLNSPTSTASPRPQAPDPKPKSIRPMAFHFQDVVSSVERLGLLTSHVIEATQVDRLRVGCLAEMGEGHKTRRCRMITYSRVVNHQVYNVYCDISKQGASRSANAVAAAEGAISSRRVCVINTRFPWKLVHTWIIFVILEQILVHTGRIDGPNAYSS